MATTKNRYRSGLEERFADILTSNGVEFGYEKTKLKYTQPEVERTYLVDFDVNGIHVETKGRLTSEDRKKMLLVIKQHSDRKFLMVFSNANKKLYKGSPTSYGEWCTKNGIDFLDIKHFKDGSCPSFTTKKNKASDSKTQRKQRQRP